MKTVTNTKKLLEFWSGSLPPKDLEIVINKYNDIDIPTDTVDFITVFFVNALEKIMTSKYQDPNGWIHVFVVNTIRALSPGWTYSDTPVSYFGRVNRSLMHIHQECSILIPLEICLIKMLIATGDRGVELYIQKVLVSDIINCATALSE